MRPYNDEVSNRLSFNQYLCFPRGYGRIFCSDKLFLEYAAAMYGLQEHPHDKERIKQFELTVSLYNALNHNMRIYPLDISSGIYYMDKLGKVLSFQSYLEDVKHKPYRFPLKFDKKDIKPVKLSSKAKDKVELVELNQNYLQYDYFKYTDYIKP